MENRILSHRDLGVWQKSVALVDHVYSVTEKFPKHELYGLTSQIRRASVSVPSNIAEGNGRGTTQDYIRFLYGSYGSLMEVDTQIHIAKNRTYLTNDDENALVDQLAEIGRMLNGLINSLERRKLNKEENAKSRKV